MSDWHVEPLSKSKMSEASGEVMKGGFKKNSRADVGYMVWQIMKWTHEVQAKLDVSNTGRKLRQISYKSMTEIDVCEFFACKKVVNVQD